MSKWLWMAALTVSATAHGQPRPDITIFGGIAFGGPVNLPSCADVKDPADKLGLNVTELCISEFGTEPTPDAFGGRTLNLILPDTLQTANNEQCGLLFGSAGHLQVVNGTAEGISIATDANQQQKTLAMLMKKYGKPSTRKNYTAQNVAGATVQGVRATWRFKELSVLFLGRIDDKLGAITVSTPKLASYRAAAERAKPAPKF